MTAPTAKSSTENAAPVNSPWNVPNAITASRLVLTLVLLAVIDRTNWWLTATILFIVAALTDALDGYLARKWNQKTTLGRILDPFVDKVLIGGSLIFLTAIPASGVTAWLTFVVIAREMFITGLRSMLEQRGIDFSAQLSGKLKMVLQSVAVPVCLLSLSPEFLDWLGSWNTGFALFRTGILWATLAITLYSGIEYTWRAWKLSQPQ
ncbi:MAG: CDP-diacylglycerol--glycerol-3-phosphate 3-phosphatidyltransferase [Planctomycetaceae bacterium]|nr:CDP-diacylglycerol--glycerol-3-phosphate 3-phosphatidyltransferase [Planctomycetaceae bacterium]